MKRFPLVLILALIPTLTLTGWWRTYGDEKEDQGFCVTLTDDGGYIVVGYTAGSLIADDTYSDLLILKLDAQGYTLWSQNYGTGGFNVGSYVYPTTDGGYIVTGSKNAIQLDTGGNLWLLKLNGKGDTIWTRTYTISSSGYCVKQTSDGGYVVTGRLGFHLWLLKIDEEGDTIWTKIYKSPDPRMSSEGYSVDETFDGGYIVTGSYDPYVPETDIWVLRTDKYGDTIWTATYDSDESADGSLDFGYSVIETSDSNYVVCGTADPEEAHMVIVLLKYDNEGNSLWSRKYPTGANWRSDRRPCVIETDDGGYAIVGVIKQESHEYLGDLWLIKTDSLGNLLWSRVYGEEGEDFGCSIQQTQDKGYIICGSTRSFGAGRYDVWLLKTDSLGLVDSIEEPDDTISEPEPSWEIVTPVGPTITLRAPEGSATLDLTVFDASGRQVDELILDGSATITWGECFGPGVYFIREAVGSETRKVILIK